jgi:hypothetical protein
MSKRLLTTAVVVLSMTLAGSAFAQKSFSNALGNGSKEFTVSHAQNIWHLPADLVNFGNWTVLETDGHEYTRFGVHLTFGDHTLALYGSNEAKSAINLLTVGEGNSGIDGGNTHKGTLAWAMKLGDDMKLGVRVGIWGDSATGGDPETSKGPLVIDFGAGFGMKVGDGALDIGLGVVFGSPSDNNGDVDTHTGSEMAIGFLAKFSTPMGDHALIPYLQFGFTTASDTPDGGDEATASELSATLGMDVAVNVGKVITVQPGVFFGFASSSSNTGVTDADDANESTITIGYNLAVVAKANNWLSFVAGGSQAIEMNSADQGDSSSSDSDVQHAISTGARLTFGDVKIDVQVNNGFWTQGPYLITGDNSSEFGMNASISYGW